MIRITARIGSDFTYDHCEMILANTCYCLYQQNGIKTVVIELPDSSKLGCKEIEEDLLNLGLLCDCLSTETVV